ncbi:MAG: UDP-N-acetylmuramate dehydrogenase [Solirubrobacteraceae bacterium]
MKVQTGAQLSRLTTLRVGGPARRLIEASDEQEIVEAVREADAAGDRLLVMGQGSNLVVADEGFDGTVVRFDGGGVTVGDADRVRIDVGAGAPWDQVVGWAVAEGLSGLECLSGIPGLSGATPIQNVGAYGQEVAQTIVSVHAYDRKAEAIVELSPPECGFAYRTSAFKGLDRHVVLRVTFELERTRLAQPLEYPELARALDAELGDRPPLAEVRQAVVRLRRAKGMVLDPADPDSVSAGSFFLNPLVSEDQMDDVRRRALDRLGQDVIVPGWPQDDGTVKLSAAWLIERAGFTRGYGSGRAGISSKHTLALVNRGGASAEELVALAQELRDGVREAFGVTLTPEPTLVGVVL